MQDQYVSRCQMFALVLWGMSAGTLAAVWIVAAVAPGCRVAGPLMLTAGLSALVAVTCQVKWYMIRLANIARTLHGVERSDVRPLRQL